MNKGNLYSVKFNKKRNNGNKFLFNKNSFLYNHKEKSTQYFLKFSEK